MRFDCSCVDVEHFLESLDIRNVRLGPVEATYSCPFPNHVNGDDTPSAQMNLETTQFRCYACKERGNAVSFAAGVLGISPLAAIQMLRMAYDANAIDPDSFSTIAAVERAIAGERETPETPQPRLDESLLDRFGVDWRAVGERRYSGEVPPVLMYLLNRGFAPKTLEDWEFGFDRSSGRITFAVRDEDGVLVGFKARSTDGREPKYLVLGDKPGGIPRYGFPIYYPSRICFGAHRMTPGGTVVVCEGELNAIAIAERTGQNSVAINGSFFSSQHARIIRNYAERVVLFLDHDAAGNRATWGWKDQKDIFHPGIVQQLRDHVPVSLTPPSALDAAELSGTEIESLLGRAQSALVREIAA